MQASLVQKDGLPKESSLFSDLWLRSFSNYKVFNLPKITGLTPWWLSGRVIKLTTHLHLVLRLRMSGAILPIPFAISWRGDTVAEEYKSTILQ
jgi:hypothetical protein